MSESLKKSWANRLQPLVGRKIFDVRYLTPQEAEDCGWSCACVKITLDDGTLLYPSMDDEGNDAGALFIQPSSELKRRGVPECAPVI